MPNRFKNDTSDIDLRAEALGGLSAGILGTVIGYPLDLVKTRMQTTRGPSSNMFALGFRIARNGKLSSYYNFIPDQSQ